MRRSFQLSLLGGGSGRGQLFGQDVVERFVNEKSRDKIPDREGKGRTLKGWLSAISNTSATESSLEARFASEILVKVLGYEVFPQGAGRAASLYVKPGTRVTGIAGTPDGALGSFREGESQFEAVLELKTPGHDLDKPQPRANQESAVEQAFGYGTQILGTSWILVSDMVRIRLYSVESGAEYEEFDLGRMLVPGTADLTPEFDRFYWLLSRSQLISADGSPSPVRLILGKTAADQVRIREGFYDAYYRIRVDLVEAIRDAVATWQHPPSDREVLLAGQRLLDRMLFLFYCEDHPEQLIPRGTVESLIAAAGKLPGASGTKIYGVLKDLFAEVDTGSPPGSGLSLPAYNGELFKRHPVIDELDLPDSLARKTYAVADRDGRARNVRGVWGLHVYDFWRDLNEHLLGHIFEESLSDLIALSSTDETPLDEKLAERKSGGIYYTSNILADFLANSSLQAVLGESAPRAAAEAEEDIREQLEARRAALTSLKIIDLACGSGAFLVSAYRELLHEYWRTAVSQEALEGQAAKGGTLDVFQVTQTVNQAALLRDCLFGVDLLPQATEIAKLALWLRSARKGERVSDLSRNIVTGDALDLEAALGPLGVSAGEYDLVIGNPPWGAEAKPDSIAKAVKLLGLNPSLNWDTWEIFTLLGMHVLRDGGRLAYVLPDSFFYPAKAELRRQLTRVGEVEKVLNLGPDWFGPEVRMGTVLVQVKKTRHPARMTFQGTLLAGSLRRQAVRGEVPIRQVEAQRSRELPASRTLDDPERPIEVFRGRRDDQLLDRIIARSLALSEVCERGRGEEVNKAGLLWKCPSCLAVTVPGAKKKGGRYDSKPCPSCGLELGSGNITETYLVSDGRPEGRSAPYVDGDDLTSRYVPLHSTKFIRLGLDGWSYKDEALYKSPKILIRQAGVGLVATLDRTDAWVPQSIYIYRLLPDAAKTGLSLEFVLGALLSRTMAYVVFKRFAEVDPAKAHAKLTHTRLEGLPIPKLDLTEKGDRRAHDEIAAAVGRILAGTSKPNGADDLAVELQLRELWGLTADDGAYINGEFFDLPESQAVKALFPAGPPPYRQA